MKTQCRAPLAAALLIVICSTGSAQWVQTNGPTGGAITSIAISGSHWFAGGYDSGVFRTTDGGAHWTSVNAGLTNYVVNCVAV